MTRSFDSHGRNTVVLPGGQRAHKDHVAQTEFVAPRFHEVRSGVWNAVGNGLSNQTFIEAPEGIIAIDTGESIEEMASALRMLREKTSAPIAAVIYTHFHYVEGTHAIFLEGNHVSPLPIYGHEKIHFNKGRALGEVGPAYGRGVVEQFALTLPPDGADGLVNVGLGLFYKNPGHAPFTPGYIPATELLRGNESLTIAGLPVEAVHSPSDSDDSVNFFFPTIGTCVHNSVWPVLFNVYAIRGEEYRDPRILLTGLDNIIRWSPEYLVATHGPAMSGKDEIRTRVTRYRDSIQFMWDQTVRCLNKGMSTDEIASRVRLPDLFDEDIITSERYGVTEHHVRQIFAGLRGWFDGDESKLFPLEPTERYGRLIAGFGGRDAVRSQVSVSLSSDDVRWATELATWLVRSEGCTSDDRSLLATCLRTIAERTPAANIRNWCLARARHLDGTFPLDRMMMHLVNPRFVTNVPTTDLVSVMRVMVEPSGIEGINHHVTFTVGADVCGLHIRHGVAVPTNGWGGQSMVTLSRDTLIAVLSGQLRWQDAVAAGDITVSGDVATVSAIAGAIDHPSFK